LCGVAALFVALATPAWAARVVDVRMGQHPGFSRVVLELDSPVGYKVERRVREKGGSELIISLNASAQPRTLDRNLKFIERLEIESLGKRSKIHVRLSGEGLRLKEMILANPPRIVLDVLDGRAVVAKPAVKPVAKVVKPAVKKTEKKAEKQSSRSSLAPPPPQAKKPESTNARKPAPMPPVAKTRPAPVVGPAEPAPALPATRAATSLKEPDASDAGAASLPQPPASLPSSGSEGTASAPQQLASANSSLLSGQQAATRPDAISPMGGAPAASRPAPKPAATSRRKPVPAPAAVVPPGDGGLFNLTNVSLGAVGFVLLAGAALIFIRRRNQAEVVDASAFGNPLGEENPFASLDDSDLDDGSPIIDAPPIADPSPAQEGAQMETVSESASTVVSPPPGGGPVGAQSAALGGGDVARLMGEFERRVAGMEARIDELVEAKERLERQVAAQTEELRVQRAAIARTQRAVRNMSRPVDDSATEPAERDPSRPEGPRG
jgi:hypothetical protein